MPEGFLLQQLDYVYFLYGLSFILLAASAMLMANSGKVWKPWRLLGLFGATHGCLEWVDMVGLCLGGFPAPVAWVQSVLLGASYVILLQFAREGQATLTGRTAGPSLYVVLLALASVGGFWGPQGLNASCRLALALPGGLWAAWVIRDYTRSWPVAGPALGLAAWTMGVYALVAGLSPPAVDFFPATICNQQHFLALAGFPVQLLRAFLAAGMAGALWVARGRIVAAETGNALAPVPLHYALRMVGGLVCILLGGWFAVDFSSSFASRQRQAQTEVKLKLAASSIDAALSNADRFAELLASRLTEELPAALALSRLEPLRRLMLDLARAIPGSVVFFLDPDGVVRMSSTPQTRPSMAGLNFAFRPYFTDALRFGTGQYVAMGATSNTPGYYSSALVKGQDGEPLGVAVIKLDLTQFAPLLRQGGLGVLTDANGVVMVATGDHYLKRPLYPLPPEVARELARQEQYAAQLNAPILSSAAQGRQTVLLDGRDMVAHMVSREPGNLRFVVLEPLHQSRTARLGAILLVTLTALLHVAMTTMRQRRRENALALDAANRRYQQMFTDSRSIQLLIDPATHTIEDANPAAQAFYGFTPDVLPGKPVSHVNILPREDIAKAMATALEQASSFLMKHRCKDGVRDVEVHSAKVQSAGKTLLHSIVYDITDRLANERAMAEVLDLNRKIIEQSPVGVMAFKAHGPCVLANQASASILGTTRQELLAMSFRGQPNPLTPELVDQALAALESGNTAVCENHPIASFGRTVRADCILTPFTSSGEAHLLVIVNEVTQKFEAEQALSQAKTLAEDATRAKSEFLANVSHEIRTPMNAILGLGHLALKTNLTAKQRDYLAKIQEAARTLLGLVNDILDLSKIEAGKFEMEATQFRLDELLNNIANVLSVKAGEKGLELLFVAAPDVPINLVGDPLRLSQVLTNLAGNAIKFTPKGEVVLSVELVRREGSVATLRFAVMDTGIGIAPELKDKLFSPFTQADGSTTRQFGGTGLGLSISKRLVELMGGAIVVNSQPGLGSTFSFSAPFGVSQPGVSFSCPPPAELAGLKALVASDSPAARQAHQAGLANLGFTTLVAESGAKTLSILESVILSGERPCDAVLLDWHMVGLDGLETASRIKSLPGIEPKPKVLLLTAFGREELLPLVGHVGVDGVLPKPVSHVSLREALCAIFAAKPKTAPHPHDQPAPAASPLAGRRVLLVEDNPVNQQVGMELLRASGVRAELAANGQEAVDKATKPGQKFDAVLMDVQMPVMNGFEATRIIRQRLGAACPPVIAMTAHALANEVQACLEAGMVDHVPKPVEPGVLCLVLARWICSDQGALAALAASPGRAKPARRHVGVPSYPGVDCAGAVNRLGGNAALYVELMQQFSRDYQSFGPAMQESLNQDDLAPATAIAHTLKGTAAVLGAKDLAQAASELERALAQDQRDDLPELMRNILNLLEPILSAVPADASMAATDAPADNGPSRDAPEPKVRPAPGGEETSLFWRGDA